MTQHELPILDAPRPVANEVYFRGIHDHFGMVAPDIEECGGGVAMPVRLTHDAWAGWAIEVGPYTFYRDDVARLRDALRAYGQATGEGFK